MDPGGRDGVGRARRAAARQRAGAGHGRRRRRELRAAAHALRLGRQRAAHAVLLLREVEVQRALHAQLVFYHLFDKKYLL